MNGAERILEQLISLSPGNFLLLPRFCGRSIMRTRTSSRTLLLSFIDIFTQEKKKERKNKGRRMFLSPLSGSLNQGRLLKISAGFFAAQRREEWCSERKLIRINQSSLLCGCPIRWSDYWNLALAFFWAVFASALIAFLFVSSWKAAADCNS